MSAERKFPEWCLLCARMAHDNSCGHLPGPVSDAHRAEPGGAA